MNMNEYNSRIIKKISIRLGQNNGSIRSELFVLLPVDYILYTAKNKIHHWSIRAIFFSISLQHLVHGDYKTQVFEYQY